MFKKIKEYFAEKREIRKLMLDTMRKANIVATSASLLMDNFMVNFEPDKLKDMIEGINKIAQNPDLQTAYFQQVSSQAHAERMTESKEK